jgi:hypothetical protein
MVMFLGHDPTFWGLLAVGIIGAAVIFVRRRKLYGPAKWDPRPPTTRERIVSGFYLVAFVATAANYYAHWRLFRGYDNYVFLAIFLVGLLLIERLPGVTHTKS